MKRHVTFVLAAALAASTLSTRASAQIPYDSCGVLVPGVTCTPLFQDANLVTWLLSNNGGFAVGDVLRVTGQADPGCITFCQQGGCISVTTIALCQVPVGTPFCPGDGTGAPCPCGNTSGLGFGCTNSTGLGAGLSATGVASVSADTVVLGCGGMPDGPGLFFQGTTAVNGGLGVSFGDGLRCAGGTVVRLGIVNSALGNSIFPQPGGSALSTVGGVAPGDVRRYQVWYRDSSVFCTSSTFNLSNGLEITWGA